MYSKYSTKPIYSKWFSYWKMVMKCIVHYIFNKFHLRNRNLSPKKKKKKKKKSMCGILKS